MSRFAREHRVFFFEEPVFGASDAQLEVSVCDQTGVFVCTPKLPEGTSAEAAQAALRDMLSQLMRERRVSDYILWYYTPMALDFSRELTPKALIYDCMDELSAFAGAPPAMRQNEAELFRRADLVFTGGVSLYEAKRTQHPSVHAFPSSVDVPHFKQARELDKDPADQANIPHPRIGYAGVIDERMDLDLLRTVAEAAPAWQFVLLGPVCKVDPASLPRAHNIHYLGMKPYEQLPAYFSGWEVGMLPFAQNESTKFISPTKTPEYLAAGLRVISTPIRDVVRPYEQLGLVDIARSPSDFAVKVKALLQSLRSQEFVAEADQFLDQISWDKTWRSMYELIESVLQKSGDATATPDSVSAQPDLARQDLAHV